MRVPDDSLFPENQRAVPSTAERARPSVPSTDAAHIQAPATVLPTDSVQSEAPDTVIPTESATAPVEVPHPLNIAGYVIESVLGKGGMGIVYKARQTGLNRHVALKMILHADHADVDEHLRFLREAESLARLQHPNIVQIYEIGQHEGKPYFSLEYVDGGGLDRYLAGTPQPAMDAAVLVEVLARGVQAAHDAGVIHRDLKPANVLMASPPSPPVSGGEGSGVRRVRAASKTPAPPTPLPRSGGEGRRDAPLAGFIPKITDFGLAKTVGEAGQTQSGAIMGTPSYMAPEQASGQVKTLDARADVWALGAILYECLTGRPPFKAATIMHTLHQVLSAEPVPPSQLNPAVPRDLETVCLKCLQKEPGKRYQSAAELADDLDRFVRGEMVHARPVGRIERGWRWCKRSPAVASLTAAVAVLLLAGTAVATTFAILAGRNSEEAQRRADAEEKERRRAVKSEGETRDLLIEVQREKERAGKGEKDARERLETAKQHFLTAQLLRVEAPYEQQPQKALELLHDTHACPFDVRDAAWHFYDNYCQRGRFLGHTGSVYSVSFSPDGRTLASGSKDKTVKVWDVATGHARATLEGHSGLVSSVSFSPDGRTLASGSHDKTVKLWDVATRQARVTLKGHTNPVFSVSFSPDGRTLASGSSDKKVLLWDAATGQARATLEGHSDNVSSVSFSPDCRTLASGSWDGTVKLWDVEKGQVRTTLQGSAHLYRDKKISSVAFSPDGRTLAAGCFDKTAMLWDVETGQSRLSFQGHDLVMAVAFSPDGRWLAAASLDGTMKLWDMETRQVRATVQQPSGIWSISISPDGRTLASGSSYGTVKLWDVATAQARVTFRGHTGSVYSVSFSPDGGTLASGSKDKSVRLWDVTTGHGRAILQGHTRSVYSVSFSPDGTTLASGSDDRTVKLWDVATGKVRATLQGHTDTVYSLSFSADGKSLASGSDDKTVRLWDVATGHPRATLQGHTDGVYSVSFSPDDRTVASASEDRTVKLWDVASGRARATLQGHTDSVKSVSFSPDGRTLASASRDRTVKLWDLASGKARATLHGHTESVNTVSFSADGRTLVSGSSTSIGGPGEVKMWDVATAQARATLKGHTEEVLSVAFSPEHRTLASGSDDKTVRLWDVAAAKVRATLVGHTEDVSSASFDPDGKRLVSTDDKGNTLVWNVQTGQRVDEPPPQTTTRSRVSPDGEVEIFIQSNLIHLLDRRWKAHLPPLFQPDPYWHRDQLALAEREYQRFAVAFHQARLADLEPWNPTLRLKEAEAWAKAGQNDRAARAFVQAVLFDPHFPGRMR